MICHYVDQLSVLTRRLCLRCAYVVFLCVYFSSDDWISWKVYFDALFHSISEDAASEQAKIDEAKVLIESLKNAALQASILKRGPFMAELELDSRLKQGNKIGEWQHNCV